MRRRPAARAAAAAIPGAPRRKRGLMLRGRSRRLLPVGHRLQQPPQLLHLQMQHVHARRHVSN
jgi:hypothetical protein